MSSQLYRKTFCHFRQFCGQFRGNVTSTNAYTAIYKFPYIRAAGLVNRLKVYQCAVTAFALPTSYLLGSMNVISGDSVSLSWAIGISGTLSLFLLGIVPDRLVGYVYLKDDEKTVKLSYLDYWGARRDTEIPLSDLVPLCDLPAVPTDPLYLTLRTYSGKHALKMNLKLGVVLDKSKFARVFVQQVK